MSRPRGKRLIPVCVVASHPLVMRYVLSQLRHSKKVCPVALHDAGSHRFRPLVYLVDCSALPLLLGECLARLRLVSEPARFLVIDESPLDASTIIRLGIHGFLTYADIDEALLPAILAVGNGKTWFQEDLLQQYMHKMVITNNGTLAHRSRLTLRESEIMELVKRRLSNHEIAAQLGVRDSTVKFHISNLFSKLQVTNRRDLLNKHDAIDRWEKLLVYSAIRDRDSSQTTKQSNKPQ